MFLRPDRLRRCGWSARIFINDKWDEWDDSGSLGEGKRDIAGTRNRT
jgi:hypothetical protein